MSQLIKISDSDYLVGGEITIWESQLKVIEVDGEKYYNEKRVSTIVNVTSLFDTNKELFEFLEYENLNTLLGKKIKIYYRIYTNDLHELHWVYNFNRVIIEKILEEYGIKCHAGKEGYAFINLKDFYRNSFPVYITNYQGGCHINAYPTYQHLLSINMFINLDFTCDFPEYLQPLFTLVNSDQEKIERLVSYINYLPNN